MKKILLMTFSAIVLLMAIGCGVSNRTLQDADMRINTLKEKGVPDSSLSRAVVFLYQARDSKKRGNLGLAKQSADSMMILIAQAEEQYANDMERLRPYLDSMKNVFNLEKSKLSGFQLNKLDSMIAIVDSFYTINWLLQSEAQAKVIDSLIPRLEFDEKRAKELEKRIPGKWVSTQVTTHDNDKTVHAVEKKTFIFNRNKTCVLTEEKKGKSSPYLKEDWKFRSKGTWALNGDTLMLSINRFASIKQNFWEYHNTNGKAKWILKKHPTYDSLITDGSQNRWITFADLKEDFVKK